MQFPRGLRHILDRHIPYNHSHTLRQSIRGCRRMHHNRHCSPRRGGDGVVLGHRYNSPDSALSNVCTAASIHKCCGTLHSDTHRIHRMHRHNDSTHSGHSGSALLHHNAHSLDHNIYILLFHHVAGLHRIAVYDLSVSTPLHSTETLRARHPLHLYIARTHHAPPQ